MKLIFEKSVPGRGCALLPPCDVPVRPLDGRFARKAPPRLPELAEVDLARHYLDRIVNLPCSTSLTKEDAQRVVDVLLSL